MSLHLKLSLALAVILISLGAVYMISRSGAPIPETAPTVSTTTPDTTPSIPEPTPEPKPADQPDTLRLGTPKGIVTVNNFRKLTLYTNEGIDIFKENEAYALAYENFSQKFRIHLFSPPERQPETQRAAENELMSLLGIDQEKACKLPIVITALSNNFPSANKWSFCPGNS